MLAGAIASMAAKPEVEDEGMEAAMVSDAAAYMRRPRCRLTGWCLAGTHRTGAREEDHAAGAGAPRAREVGWAVRAVMQPEVMGKS
jgi:hypothetical protein